MADSGPAANDCEVSRFAPAKINLALHVTGKRSDGYHLLDSLVVFATVGDVVTVKRGSRTGDPVRLTAAGEFADQLPAADLNIVSHAVTAIRRAGSHSLPKNQSLAVHLTKALPCAAGLGGGSADAAATLIVLDELWALGLAADKLEFLAQSLGADVPACLSATPKRLRGTGELLDPVVIDFPFAAVLVNSGDRCLTAQVFERLDIPGRPPLPDLPARFTDPRQLLDWLQATGNDLEAPARSVVPQIGIVLHQLKRLRGCLLARMTGSGATCFGLFATDRSAEAAADALRIENPNWWITATVLNPAAASGR